MTLCVHVCEFVSAYECACVACPLFKSLIISSITCSGDGQADNNFLQVNLGVKSWDLTYVIGQMFCRNSITCKDGRVKDGRGGETREEKSRRRGEKVYGREIMGTTKHESILAFCLNTMLVLLTVAPA